MDVTRSTRAGNGVLWGTSIGTFLIFIIMERRLFMRYLDETGWLLAIVGIVFGVAMLSIFGGRALPTRWLAMAILSGAVILALCWFLLYFDLPAVELNNEDEAMAWVKHAQIVMLVIQLSSQPILLIEWTCRCNLAARDAETRGRNEAGLTSVSLIVAGTIAAIAGLMAGSGDRWPVLVGCLSSAATAGSMVFLHGHAAVDPGRRRIENTAGRSDANLLFRDIAITMLASIPGFTMMERDMFLFPSLLCTGASLAAFGAVHVLVARVRNGTRANALGAIEGTLIALYIVSLGMFIYLYRHNMSVDIPSGIPEFITGFALGYFWTRVMHVGEGIEYPKGFPLVPRRGIGQDATAKLVTFLLVLLIGASVAISVSPVDPQTIMYVYPISLGVAAVDLLLWTLSSMNYKA